MKSQQRADENVESTDEYKLAYGLMTQWEVVVASLNSENYKKNVNYAIQTVNSVCV